MGVKRKSILRLVPILLFSCFYKIKTDYFYRLCYILKDQTVNTNVNVFLHFNTGQQCGSVYMYV